MEEVDIMDNRYGRQDVPEKMLAGLKEDKYWGFIQSIYADDEFTLKEIFMKAGTQSSMEYHLSKDEKYFIREGKLKLGLRIGRAQNKSIILEKGDVYHVPPGLMHMRMAIEDTTIIEWSNKDDDSDSNIVEDGKTYEFKESE
jgi:mannose-6-phosphate isomerase|tara:strand:- start:1020 stop:1445 length:426 start_codon:yes stop_codon:yes gene_type:complete